jgi:hypothetical protein
MFNTDFVTVKQVQEERLRDAEKRQATYRLSRELRDAALARANAANQQPQPLVSRIVERLHLKRDAQDISDVAV